MTGRIPAQRANTTEVPERATAHIDPICVHGLERSRCGHCCDEADLPGLTLCAVEDCDQPGTRRYFPAYVLTLCGAHWLRAADRARHDRTYW